MKSLLIGAIALLSFSTYASSIEYSNVPTFTKKSSTFSNDPQMKNRLLEECREELQVQSKRIESDMGSFDSNNVFRPAKVIKAASSCKIKSNVPIVGGNYYVLTIKFLR